MTLQALTDLEQYVDQRTRRDVDAEQLTNRIAWAQDSPLSPRDLERETGLEFKQDYAPEQAREYPTSVEIDGRLVHLHQRVIEQDDNPLSDEGVQWTIVSLANGAVKLANAGAWDRFRNVPHEEFDADTYEAQWLNVGDRREPEWGY